MKPLPAILTTFALLAASIGAVLLTGYNVTWIMILCTAIWIAIDSRKIELKKYQSGISYGPLVLFIATCLLWIVAFPWYLIIKERIKSGRAFPKEGSFGEDGTVNVPAGRD